MGCSPRVGIGERRGAGCSAAWTGGGACLGARGQADVGTLRVPGSLGSSRGVPAEVLRGSGDTERTRRRGNSWRSAHRRRRFKSKFRRWAWRNLGAEASRSATGSWRCYGAASSRPGCGGAARPRRSRGSARRSKARRAELGFAGRRVGWMGAGGITGRFKRRGAGDLRGARPIRKAARDHGDATRPLRARKTDLAGGPGRSAGCG
jgi:hypothetical protein